jgi:large subunit ribosomal protein L17
MAMYRKLGRSTDQRIAMFRSLTTNLLKYGKIETTVTRAKETRKFAERMITLGKALSFITEESVVQDLFENIAPKYAERNGGYTRIMRVGPRRGDAAELSIIELV